ncbi:hypothetical protein Cch01nite_09390 [Cellulomonas chitinilytica]|uniref:DUF998 domain-containing protein n=1 Tax=Cellulomonas chitinilytica TaxID=398759 RepID=A0A919P042_9CELL|nr:hypothetical protein [Cellulomonas chitinilytica]GIG20215.1 hypothetical protein Cch01nite_09390 [Cellulomonas chitinilytica]
MRFDEFVTTPPRPAPTDLGGRKYVQSFLLIRLVIGFLGWSLPIVLVAGSFVLGEDDPWKDSISAYYHFGMGDVFVGAFCATALFLFSYMAFERNFDNVVSIVAGIAALGVAFFPTPGGPTLTPVQELLGERVAGAIHFTSAAVFVLALAAICWRFGRGEGVRPDRTPRQHARGRALHYTCAGSIVVAVAYIAVAAAVALPGLLDEKAVFFGETLAVLAFGVSWFVKGTELRLLLGPVDAGA